MGYCNLINDILWLSVIEYTAFDKESEILARITRLDVVKIGAYLKKIRSIGDGVKDFVESFTSAPAFLQFDHAVSFPGWISCIFTIRDLPPEPALEDLVDLVRWALEARRIYLACLQALFPGKMPSWVYAIFKLGRYAVASMVLLHSATGLPALFNPMLVEPVIAPPKIRFISSKEEKPLSSVLRRLANDQEVNHYISRLAQTWSVRNPEAHFRNTCTLDLPVHAEMQLLNFYDHNPERRPSFHFIGVSKKSFFLCHCFLARHPQSFSVSSCHQKLYLAGDLRMLPSALSICSIILLSLT